MSGLCNYSDVYILIKGTLTVANTGVEQPQVKEI